MATRTVYLVMSREAQFQRAHFSIFVPSAADPERGTQIHAVGTPMSGYALEFKRNHAPSLTGECCEILPIGQVDSANVVDATENVATIDSTPSGKIQIAATQVPTPRKSENFMAPVNDTTNKRCQEWTMEFIRYLVTKGFIGKEAIDIVQSKRDPPNHGVALQPVARR